MSIKQQKANSKMTAPTIRPLESCKRAQFKDDYNIIILEQWKTCVEMANCNSEKRNTMNTLYIIINSALIAVISFAWENKSIFLSIVGIFVCLLWLGALKSYKQLSVVKYDIIQKIENKLPLAPSHMNGIKSETRISMSDKLKLKEFFLGHLLYYISCL